MKSILVIDDDKVNLATARMVLRDEYKVIPVTSGAQALIFLEKNDCDIILLDINMPEMNGFETLRKIREMQHCQHIPVIFLTADNDAETETRCFKEGAIDFIVKPFVSEVMRSRIGRVLELEELRRGLADRLEQKTREASDMKSKSCQDALTGLWNRTYTEEAVNGLLSQGAPGVLLMIDMDNFKVINDSYGHIAGDRTLRMLADILRSVFNEGDILCRIGGDEFMVFARDITERSEISNRASRIISELTNKLEKCDFKTNTSVSIGIAKAPENGTEFLKLYNSADKALYYVKQNGKNSYHFFSDKLQTENSRGEKNVDLGYLQDLMNRTDNGGGAYSLDFESFHHVYNFIRRFVERSRRDVQTLLFTVVENDSQEPEVAATELALELLEKAIYTSLRRSDVSTRYSSKQLIVILMDANGENGDMVAGRILESFNKLYTNGKVQIEYGIARMDG